MGHLSRFCFSMDVSLMRSKSHSSLLFTLVNKRFTFNDYRQWMCMSEAGLELGCGSTLSAWDQDDWAVLSRYGGKVDWQGVLRLLLHFRPDRWPPKPGLVIYIICSDFVISCWWIILHFAWHVGTKQGVVGLGNDFDVCIGRYTLHAYLEDWIRTQKHQCQQRSLR